MGIVVTVEELRERLPEVVRMAREGERVVVTENGEPVVTMAAVEREHPLGGETAPQGNADIFERARRWLDARGIEKAFPYVAPDFDEPMPDSFWLGEDDETSDAR